MTLLCNLSETHTSAVGSMYRFTRDATASTILIATALPELATANTCTQGSMAMWATIAQYAERTVTGPTWQIEHVPVESTAEAVMEIRRRSGLTWEELGNLFDVSRRSVHHWANGKPVASGHYRMIRRMLAAIRHLDRGNQLGTRAVLLAVNQATGESTLDLLKDGRFDEARGCIADVSTPKPHLTHLSRAALDARRPQVPALLLQAKQDRPDLPAKARAFRPKRTPKSAS